MQPTWSPVSSPEVPIIKGYGSVREGPEESHKSGQRTGTLLLRRKTESRGCSAWRRRWGDLTVAFQCIKGGYKKDGERLLVGPVATGQGAMVKEVRFRLYK